MKKNTYIKIVLTLSVAYLMVYVFSFSTEIPNAKTAYSSATELRTAYKGLRDFTAQTMMFSLDEVTTDAIVVPTRGGDWDDNGTLRQLHSLSWGPNHNEIRSSWFSLFQSAQACNEAIKHGTSSEITQARFLRAFYYYNFVDLFGQVPYNDTGVRYGGDRNDIATDTKVMSRSEATDFIISELETLVSSLPARTANDASIVNKDAAHFLLAKLYLNKAVFKTANPAGPYTFDAADMTKVVQNVDAITNTLAAQYWDNFAPANNTSNEIIFSSKNIQGGEGGNIQAYWRMGTHYNQTPSGWNGFSTVADYYNTFDPNDTRAHYSNPNIISSFGNPVGFQIGQQYAPGGVTPLRDRNSNLLIYTAAVSQVVTGAAIETAGIRGMKYIPDTANEFAPDNDLVLMRYSDAQLMKAEAILRGGTGSGTDAIMTSLAKRAGVTAAPSNLDGIYAERGRELWWEGWRRNDMIRFGKYLNARQLKPYVSNAKYVLFPIPTEVLYNVNIKQNPGY